MKSTISMALTLALILLYAACAHGQIQQQPTDVLEQQFRALDAAYWSGQHTQAIVDAETAIRQELDRRYQAQIEATTRAIEGVKPKPHAIWAPYSASMPTATLQARYDALQREIDSTNDYLRLGALLAEQEPIRKELDRRDIAQIEATTRAIEGKGKP